MTKRSSSVTIRDVARQAGVSVATVSRYLNQNAPVSEKLSERIRKVMEHLDYVPHATARQLAKGKKHTIGLLLTNMHNDFFAPLLAGVEGVVNDHGYNLLVATCRPALRNDYQFPVGRHNTDGLLVFADCLNDQQIAQFHDRQLPLVLIHKTPANGLNVPFVTVENKAASYKLVDHLISVHGCRRIILMRGPEQQEDSHWREVGYKDALAAHGIAFDEALILQGSFEREIAYNAMKSFLEDPQHPEFDAVFAGDDDAAVGVFDALKEARLRIPEDVSVVGFDDSRMAPFLTPPLTTVRAPTEEVGRSAAQKLFCLLEGKTPEPATLHPTEMIIRRSCGCNSQAGL
ncbi:MAG: LacI family transcriptional regulator [Chloroflexi bacterium]|nr:LacI family transcriptional regulator [Chloroflexota bacterium]MCI0575152.1 LacI family transcriptional regulator [Chloroflexota bacterium]MCI0647166.1 LacI family transcriptional regulator [Chloroflexota bacterium]MCI0729958.1 LacI family transcriptional regulator [Chloroflexota bacterium]